MYVFQLVLIFDIVCEVFAKYLKNVNVSQINLKYPSSGMEHVLPVSNAGATEVGTASPAN